MSWSVIPLTEGDSAGYWEKRYMSNGQYQQVFNISYSIATRHLNNIIPPQVQSDHEIRSKLRDILLQELIETVNTWKKKNQETKTALVIEERQLLCTALKHIKNKEFDLFQKIFVDIRKPAMADDIDLKLHTKMDAGVTESNIWFDNPDFAVGAAYPINGCNSSRRRSSIKTNKADSKQTPTNHAGFRKNIIAGMCAFHQHISLN